MLIKNDLKAPALQIRLVLETKFRGCITVRLMEWVYPNLIGEQFSKAMTGAFWLFIITTLVLSAAILGLKVGAISSVLAHVIEQGIGPVISINMVVLFYLADQNRRAGQQSAE